MSPASHLLHKRRRLLLEKAFENSPESMVITDPEGVIVDINPAFTTLFGYSRDQALGRKTSLLKSPRTSREFYQRMWDDILSRGSWQGEILNRSCSEEEIPVFLTITPILHRHRLLGYLGVHMDLREKKAIEKQLFDVQPLVSAGRISSQLSHEVGNGLFGLGLYMQIMEDEFEEYLGMVSGADNEVENLRKHFIHSRQEIRKLQETLKDYRSITHSLARQRSRFKVSEFGERIIAGLINECARSNIRLEWFAPADDVQVEGDEFQLERVFVNLVHNAVEMMPNGGVIRFGASESKGKIVLWVSDDGPGVPEDLQKKIFEPFFTTKDSGSGIGLWVAREVIHAHGGRLWFENNESKGATFFVKIPCVK